MLADDVAVVVQDLIHQIGGIQVAAVDGGRLGPDQLQGRDVEGLAEGVGGQGHHVGVEVLLRGKDAAPHLRRQIHAGGLHEAEGLEILVISLGADLEAHGDKGRVAGVAGGGFQILHTVAGVVGAVDGLVPALNPDGPVAGEGGVHGHLPLLQGGGQGHRLEGGAGLVGILIALVAPLLELGGSQGFVIFFGALRKALQRGQELFVGDGAVIVGIVIGVRGHGHDGAGVDVHDDAGGTVFGVELLHHALDALFQVILDIDIQGQHQVAAVFRVVILLIVKEQGLIVVVLGCDRQSGGAGEDAVILRLQAVGADVVGVDEAQYIGGQGAVAVVALGVGPQENAPQGPLLILRHRVALVVDLAVDKAAHLVGHVLLRLFHQLLILGLGLLHLGEDRLLIQSQDPGKTPGNIALVQHLRRGVGLALLLRLFRRFLDGVLLVIHKGLDLQGREEDQLRRGGFRQNVAAAVIDGAPGGGDHGAGRLLGHRLFLQLRMLADLQVVELPEEGQECHHAQ